MNSLEPSVEPMESEVCALVEEEIQPDPSDPFQGRIDISNNERFSPLLLSQAAFQDPTAIGRDCGMANNTILVHTISSGPADTPHPNKGNPVTSNRHTPRECGFEKLIDDSCNLRVIRLPDEELFFIPAQSNRDTLERDTLEEDADIEGLIADLFCQDDCNCKWNLEIQELLLLDEEDMRHPVNSALVRCERLKKQLRSVSCSPQLDSSKGANTTKESCANEQPPPKKRRRRERGFVNVKERKYRELWKGRLSPTSLEKLDHLIALKPTESLQAVKFINVPPFPDTSSGTTSSASSVDEMGSKQQA